MVERPRVLLVGARGLGGHEGGVEKFADEFVSRAKTACEVDVLCLRRSHASQSGVNEILVPRLEVLTTDKTLYMICALWLFATKRYDRVLILGINFGSLVPLMKAMIWRKGKIYVRSGSVDYLFGKWGTAINRILRFSESMLAFADGVIAVAPSVQNHLRARGLHSFLVRNGVTLTSAQSSRLPARPLDVLAVGRITPPKNYKMLAKAAPLLAPAGVTITIVGGMDLSSEGDELLKLAASETATNLNLTGQLTRREVSALMSNCGLFVNCSTNEGMSNAILEAIQSGAPIILSDIPANRDLGLPEHFYFDPCSPEAIARKVTEALACPGNYMVDPSRLETWDSALNRLLAFLQIPSFSDSEVPLDPSHAHAA